MLAHNDNDNFLKDQADRLTGRKPVDDPKRARRCENAILAVMLLGIFIACLRTLPEAIDKEQVFNENIIIARCNRHWIDGYCKGLPHNLAEAR